MANRWIITYVDGGTEETPSTADTLKLSGRDASLLQAVASRTYGPDEVVKTYVLANVRSWEPA